MSRTARAATCRAPPPSGKFANDAHPAGQKWSGRGHPRRASAARPLSDAPSRKRTVKSLHQIVLAVACGAAAALSLPAFAQHEHHAAAAPAAAKAADMSEGEVRKVDVEGRKITLKHGPLKNLDMPGMTMAFQVADPAMLTRVKVGDNVRFVAANPGGRLTITRIEAAK
jgi:Cu(I)/Ag(I) efflux system periplasmic protein CusF